MGIDVIGESTNNRCCASSLCGGMFLQAGAAAYLKRAFDAPTDQENFNLP